MLNDKNALLDEINSLKYENSNLREKIRESEERYRTLSESVEEFIFIINAEDNVEYVNDYSALKLGVAREKILNQPRWKLFPPKTYDMQSESLQLIFELGETIKRENLIEINEGEIWMETLLIPLKNETGTVEKVLGVARDITDRKNYEILLERQNNILKGMKTILRETIGSVTRNELAQTCLKVCEDITGSEFGFISEVNSEKRLATLAVSKSIHVHHNLGEVDVQPMLENLNVHKAWKKLLGDKRSLIFNKPIFSQKEVPHDHFHMKNHLLVPLIREGEIVGMIGLSNKESGYNVGDRQAVEALSTTVVEALMRKNAEEKLSRSRENLQKILSSVSFGIIIVGKDKTIKHVNKTALEMMGYTSESDLVGQTCHNTLCPSLEHQCPILDMEQCLDKSEGILMDNDGNEIPIIKSAIPIVMDGEEVILESFIDITALKRAEKALEKALDDKEMLMKEVYHRVKNNLMVISSLLNLQSDYITDEEAKDIFKDSQKRAHSMALIHERLYRSTDLKNIDFGDYIRTLVMDLFRTYLADPSRVKLELDVEDVMLDIDTAIPLGLIVNELVSNSMKHAFPEGRKGTIKLKFKSCNDGCLLVVADDGIGLPTELDITNTDTLGLQLVNSLSGQIDAEIEVNNLEGTEFRIRVKETQIM